MPEIPSFLKQVLKDISNVRGLIDDSCSPLKKALKKVDFENKHELSKVVQKTKNLVEKLKKEVDKIDTYFQDHYQAWMVEENELEETETSENDSQQSLVNASTNMEAFGKESVINFETTSRKEGLSENGISDENVSDLAVGHEGESPDLFSQNNGDTIEADGKVNSNNIENCVNESIYPVESNAEKTDGKDHQDDVNKVNQHVDVTKDKEANENLSLNCTSHNEDVDSTNTDDSKPEECDGSESVAVSNDGKELYNTIDQVLNEEHVEKSNGSENSGSTEININVADDTYTSANHETVANTVKDDDKDGGSLSQRNECLETSVGDDVTKELENLDPSNECLEALDIENNCTDVSNKSTNIENDSEVDNEEVSINAHEEGIFSNDTVINDSHSANDNVKSGNIEIEQENKWKIKCVDISKLMSPNLLSKKENQDEDLNESVVILSDSEVEDDRETESIGARNLRSKRQTQTSNAANRQCKNIIVLDDSDSSNDLPAKFAEKSKSQEEKCKSRLKKNKTNELKRDASDWSVTVKRKKSVTFNILDDNSDDLVRRKPTRSQAKSKKAKKLLDSSSDDESLSRLKKKQKKKSQSDVLDISSCSDTSSDSDRKMPGSKLKRAEKKKRRKESAACVESRLLREHEDVKLSWKSCVPLTKIPAAKLKENYEKRLLKGEIKRLTNMDSLKRSRHARKGSQSSSDSADTPEVKKKPTRENVGASEEKKVTGCNGSDVSVCEADPLALSDVDHDEGGKDKEVAGVNGEKVLINAVLDGIVSGTDSSAHNSGNDSIDGDAGSRNEIKKSKEAKETDKDKSEKRTNDDDVEGEEEKSGSNEADGSKSKNWRKDELLTEKLSESDSDENFDKFVKKKEKLAEALSNTEDVAPKIVVKRLGKRRSRIVNSDSDSSNSNKKKSGEDDSDKTASESSDSSDSDVKKKTKSTKRRRIKALKDSSDEDVDDDEKDTSTRKNIRKVWARDSLAETTKQAEKEEQERKARIIDRQKKYNEIFESGKLEKATVEKVILDFNEDTKEELLKVNKKIVKQLKPHQAKGIHFMWNACFESLARAKSTKGSGCILAHCMGLGKTLQVIALIHALLKNEEDTGISKVLVVTPLNTVLNWVAEFKKWLPEDDDNDVVEVYELVSYKPNYERQYQVQSWSKRGGVLILGYDMFRNLTNANNKRINKKMKNVFQTSLVDPGPDLVVCDEGHLLKNEKSSISIAMNRLRTLRRIVLTGTPLQNNLKEYFCMVQFVKPNLLGTYKEYLNRFVNPITNGQYTDSTPHDIQVMRKRSHVLHKMLDGVVQRRDYSVLAPFLPPKYEYVLFINLTDVQVRLYEFYMKEKARRTVSNGGKSYLFIDFQELLRICTHPRVLLDKSIEVKLAREKKDLLDDEEDSEGSLKDFIDDGEESTSDASNSSGSDSEPAANNSASTKSRRVTRATAVQNLVTDSDKDDDTATEEQADPAEWWKQFCEKDELDCIKYSGKLFLLFEILHECEQIGDKVLVFSQSLYSLNVIEYFLSKIDEATQNSDTGAIGGYPASWALGLDYFRLDGTSSCDNRATWCKTFNDPENTRARLFLISTRAGGLGINLVAANRVIIFDVSWNPSHDIQSIYRIYRFGQTKPCYVYRFVTLGTMEMKIYERQVIKQAISKRVIDEQQIDRHYNQNDLAELYKFEPVPDEDRPIPLVPKDILLGELLQKHENRIFKYHEHQSLLENKEEEGLNEEERKAAWEEFEYEKKARQFPTIINNIPITSIVMALTSIIHKDNPSWDNAAVQSIVPQLVAELEQQLNFGNMTMYNRILNEMRLMQSAKQQQRMQELYFRQQQALLMRQYQLLNQNSGQFMPSALSSFRPQQPSGFNPMRMGQAGSSTNQSRFPTTSEVIDLND